MREVSDAILSVVTGPAGHDIGPVCAELGRDLGDGLTIRTIISDGRTGVFGTGDRNTAHEHHSPTPPGTVVVKGGVNKGREIPHTILWALPSAWQNPDTNLGVAFTGPATRDLAFDVDTLAEIGWNPSHRVTVSHSGFPAADVARARDVAVVVIPMPIEIGPLDVVARDAVLRGAAGGSRRVLIEAGDGQTFLGALNTVGPGVSPWSPHIDRLDLWLVVDAAVVLDGAPISAGAATKLVVAKVRDEVARQGGGVNRRGERMPALKLAILGADLLIPAITGHTDETFNTEPANGGTVTDTEAIDVGKAIADIEHRTGARIGLLGTGAYGNQRATFLHVDS